MISTWAAVLVSTKEIQKTKLSGYPQRKLETVLVMTSEQQYQFIYSPLFLLAPQRLQCWCNIIMTTWPEGVSELQSTS